MRYALYLLLCALPAPLPATDAAAALAERVARARAEQASFQPDPARARQWFSTAHANDWSCASCHTRDPRQPGRHVITGRALQPLSPLAAPSRFTDAAKTEKWFKRNCQDVLDRPCTAAEQADVLAYLLQPGA